MGRTSKSMQPSSFEYVPECDVQALTDQQLLQDTAPSNPPQVPLPRSIESIAFSSNANARVQETVQATAVHSEKKKRLYVRATRRQREILVEEFTKFGTSKPIKYYVEKTRVCSRTLRRLIADIQSGKDVTMPAKRWRKPKYTPDLLKKIASELCVRNKSLREAKKTIIQENADAVGTDTQQLPVVSISSMSRYVKDKEIMEEIDIGPLSFTQVSLRGPTSNTDANKDLRIERRRQLDSFIMAGYTVVFVDESHWSIGNVRTRAWGPKGEKHIRTERSSSISLSCICSISDSGQRHCKLFNTTINAEIFKAYMKELISLYRLDNENVIFVMDNASIHREEIRLLCETYGCKVLFNAPYSPECNPIEMVFGIWKTRVGKLSNVDLADLLRNLSRCFEEIAPSEVKRCIAHFLGPVTTKIMNREDL